MKKVRTIVSITLVVTLVLLSAGCQKQSEGGAKKQAAKDLTEMEGTLTSFGGSTLVMKDKDGNSYSFDVSAARIRTQSMLAGDGIVVVFAGDLNGTDTSSVKVESVSDRGQTQTAEQTVVGTLVNATANAVTIKTNDGKELTFSTINAELNYKNGIKEGNWLQVTYVGTLEGTETQNIKVLQVVDKDPNIEKYKQEIKIKATDEKVYATAGVHIRESYSADAQILGSLAKGEMTKRTGICANGWSRIVFNGKDAYVYGDYLSKDAPKKSAKPAKTSGAQPGTPQTAETGDARPKPEKQPPKKEKPKTVSGIVAESQMSTLTLLIKDQQLSLDVSNAAHSYKNGILMGNSVTVSYTGDLAKPESVVVVSVTDQDVNADNQSKVSGTIQDVTMNTLTLKTTDNAIVHFFIGDARNQAEELAAGAQVAITLDLSQAVTTSNVFTAVQIDSLL